MKDKYLRFMEPRLCSVVAGVAVAASAAAGAYESSQASSAASGQANAARGIAAQQMAQGQNAANMLLGQRGIAEGYFQPYQQLGQGAAQTLGQEMPQLTQAFNPTQAQLSSMPGYQFQLQQGLEATQNGFAARGLGSSGAAMKGAANYAEGLANSNYMNDANIFYQNENNAYNKLAATANLGLNAASGAAQANTAYTGAAANALIGQSNAAANSNLYAAQAQAAGQVAAANDLGQGITNAANMGLGYSMYQGAMNGGGSPSSSGWAGSTAIPYASPQGTAYSNGMYGSTGLYNPMLFGGAG